MQRRKVNRFNDQQLVASEKILQLESALSQYVSIPMIDNRWNFGGGDFMISFLTSLVSSLNCTWAQIRNPTDGAQILFAPDNNSSFQIHSNQGGAFLIPSDITSSFRFNTLYRLTIMRKGNFVEAWINNAKIGETDIVAGHTFDLYTPGNVFYLGTNAAQSNFVNGLIGNFIVLNGKALDGFEMNYFHQHNILPETVIRFCMAHYPFNQSAGHKAFDCSGQYQFSKYISWAAQPGELINYLPESIIQGGGENEFTPSSWRNLFTREPTDSSFLFRNTALRLNRSNGHYLSIANFNPTKEKGYTYMIGFALDSDRNFASLYGSGGGEGFLSKHSNSYNPWKRIIGNEGGKVVSADFGVGVGNDLKGDLSKPQVVVFTEKTPHYLRSFPFGFKGNEYNSVGMAGWDEIPDNQELRIGCQDAPGNNSLDGYLFFVGIWKGILSEHQTKQIVNNILPGNIRPEWLTDCELYLIFEQIINDGGIFKIKDWSPQNRTVILQNYSLAEITQGNPQYKIYELDGLRS